MTITTDQPTRVPDTTGLPPEDFMAPFVAKSAELRAVFEKELAKHSQLGEQLATLNKSGQAAEAEGDVAQKRLREFLRESGGHLSKKHYEMQADQRAAYALAEEYRSLGEEVSLARDRQELLVHDAALAFGEERRNAFAAFADFLINRAFQSTAMADLIAGMRIKAAQEQANSSSVWNATPFVPGLDTVEDFVTNRVAGEIKNRLKQFKHPGGEIFPAELITPLSASGFGRLSFLQRKKLQDAIAEREVRLGNSHPADTPKPQTRGAAR